MVYLNRFFFGMILKPNQTDKKKLDLIVWGSFHEYCFLDDYDDDDAMANMYQVITFMSQVTYLYELDLKGVAGFDADKVKVFLTWPVKLTCISVKKNFINCNVHRKINMIKRLHS